MSMVIADCAEYNEVRKLCVAEENGKKYVLDNQGAYYIRKVKVDGCVTIPDGYGRCDYLFSADENSKRRAYFVELKGSRGEDALKQINDTITFFKEEFAGYCLEARIVSSKSVPNFRASAPYKQLLKVIDPTGGNIKIATNKFYKDII